MSGISIESELKAIQAYQLTKGRGVKREQKGKTPLVKRKRRMGSRVVGDDEEALRYGK